ncbi:muscarinic acetylcholine receptor M5-like isoform X2 [Lineus longissimus]
MDNGTDTGPLPRSPWKLVLLLPIVIASILANILLLITVKYNKAFRHMPFYYLLSLGLLHTIMAIVGAPPEVFMDLRGDRAPYTYSCAVWVTLDTFFCNNIFLHLLGASLDAMLKTHNPFKYGRTRPKGATILKIGAPWTISLVQSTVMFAISRHDSGKLDGYVCFLQDANVHVLRFLLAYLFPLLIGFMFYIVSLLELKRHRSKTYWDYEKQTEVRALFKSSSMESLNHVEFSPAVENNSGGLINYSNSIFTLEREIRNFHNQDDDEVEENHQCGCKKRTRKRLPNDSVEDGADIIIELSPCPNPNCPNVKNHRRFAQNTNLMEHLDFNFSDENSAPNTKEVPLKSVRHRQIYLKRVLLTEERLSKILAMLYALNTILWSPYIIANLVHSMCTICQPGLSNTLFRNLKWAAYFSAIFSPFLYIVVSREVRNAYLRVVTGNACKKEATN